MASVFTVFKGHQESLLCQSVGERKRWTHSSNNEKPEIKKRPRGHETVNTDRFLQCEEELYLWENLQDPAPGLQSTLQGTEQEQKSHDKGAFTGSPALFLGHSHGRDVLQPAKHHTLDGNR